ncbi:hypothetical protein VTK73DRAFT_3612 [Phialemonium thermophilum]|uniref:Uncharacterized protein n=1 Tax=Phialemonium thermophilum TaxID=223376 RepID=A0ABR3WYN4_9PEZI
MGQHHISSVSKNHQSAAVGGRPYNMPFWGNFGGLSFTSCGSVSMRRDLLAASTHHGLIRDPSYFPVPKVARTSSCSVVHFPSGKLNKRARNQGGRKSAETKTCIPALKVEMAPMGSPPNYGTPRRGQGGEIRTRILLISLHSKTYRRPHGGGYGVG